MSEKRNVYVTMAFAGVALMVAMLIGVVVMRRRSARYPQHQVNFFVQTNRVGVGKLGPIIRTYCAFTKVL